MNEEAPKDKIVMFPGVRRERLPEHSAPSQEKPDEELTSLKILQGAVEAGLEDVVVVGLKFDGTLYVASECGDLDAVAGKLLRAANWMASIDLVDEYED